MARWTNSPQRSTTRRGDDRHIGPGHAPVVERAPLGGSGFPAPSMRTAWTRWSPSLHRVSVLEEITRQRSAVGAGDEGARQRLAEALERLALTLQDGLDRRRLFDEAFVCRRAVDIDDFAGTERIGHLLCLTADALVSDRRAELVMLLRALPDGSIDLPDELPWAEELLLRVARAFIVMARRSGGWDDVQAAAAEIARLRGLQSGRESAVLADAGRADLSSLVALYNLAREVDLAAEYLVSGSPGDVAIRLDRHHANASEILELEPDPALEHISDLLHAGLRALVNASVWTATRGLGARIALFVEALASRERDNPVLELWPSQRSALRSSLLDPAKRALVVQMPTPRKDSRRGVRDRPGFGAQPGRNCGLRRSDSCSRESDDLAASRRPQPPRTKRRSRSTCLRTGLG